MAGAKAVETAPSFEIFREQLRAFCFDCHGMREQKSGINYESMASAAAFFKHPELIEDTIAMLKDGEMPPAKAKKQPGEAERHVLMAWLEGAQMTLAKVAPNDPGPVVMPRLTPTLYSNIIRDWAGVRFDASEYLPEETEAGEGFTNVGAAHDMSPTRLEKFLQAAKAALAQARFSPHRVVWSDSPKDDVSVPFKRREELVRAWVGLHVAEEARLFPQAVETVDAATVSRYLKALWLIERSQRNGPGDPGSKLPAALGADSGAVVPWSLERWRAAFAPEKVPSFLKDDPLGEYLALLRSPQSRAEAVDAASQRLSRGLIEAHQTLNRGAKADGSLFVKQLSRGSGKGDARLSLFATEAPRWNEGRRARLVVGPVAFEKTEREKTSRVSWLEAISGLINAAGKLVAWRELPGFDATSGTFIMESGTAYEMPIPAGALNAHITVRHAAQADAPGVTQFVVQRTRPTAERLRFIPDPAYNLDYLTLAPPEKLPQLAEAKDFLKGLLEPRKYHPIFHIPTDVMPHLFFEGFDAVHLDLLGRKGWVTTKRGEGYVGRIPSLYDGKKACQPPPSTLRQSFTSKAKAELEALRAELVAEVQSERQQIVAVLQHAGLKVAAEAPPTPDQLANLDSAVRQKVEDLVQAAAERESQLEKAAWAQIFSAANTLWRRRVAAGELQPYFGLYRAKRAVGGSYDAAVKKALEAVLVSPDFLYQPVYVRADGAAAPLSDDEIATRLAFFLWGSLPDEKLRLRAAAGGLNEPAALMKEAGRMLADDRALALGSEFGGYWLGFAQFHKHVGPSTEKFPEFTPEIREAMFEESKRFLLALFRENRPITDLYEADYTWLNQPLAKFYGIPGVTGPEFREVKLPDRRRGGILGMGSLLTRTSMPLRTSPVMRGDWVLQKILGQHMPEPPAMVPMLSQEETDPSGKTIAQQLALHRADPNCASCHNRLDPPGLVLESFDPIGRWREVDAAGKRIDTKVAFAKGGTFDGVAGLRAFLRQQNNQFVDQFCAKFLGYALGRGLLASDRELLTKMKATLATRQYRSRVLLELIITSPQFRQYRDVTVAATN